MTFADVVTVALSREGLFAFRFWGGLQRPHRIHRLQLLTTYHCTVGLVHVAVVTDRSFPGAFEPSLAFYIDCGCMTNRIAFFF